MEFLAVFLIAIVLSMDAFSVAVGVGCGNFSHKSGIKMAIGFGLFQFIMPLLGAALGIFLESYFSGTKYVSALILFLIAIKMFRDAKNKNYECATTDPTKGWGILILSLATSMDAFGVGLPISYMKMDKVVISSIIGVVCFVSTLAGFYIGKLFVKYFNKAEYVGAAILFIIGVKFLVV